MKAPRGARRPSVALAASLLLGPAGAVAEADNVEQIKRALTLTVA